MEELHSCINELVMNGSDTERPKNMRKLYRLLSQTNITDNEADIFRDIIIPKLFVLIKDKKIEKDLMYLSLLPNSDKSVLQKLIDFEKSSLVLDLGNNALLCDYCLFRNEHWLLEVLQGENVVGEHVFSKGVESVINILKLVDATNHADVDLSKIQIDLARVHSVHNKFVEFYVNELERVLDVVQLCQKYLISDEEVSIPEIYHYASKNSALKTFSKFVNLQSFDACDSILLKLKEYKIQSEVEVFTAYIIVFNILRCLHLCKTVVKDETVRKKDDISEIVEETETKLVNLNNLRLQIEILENIFALLFLQKERCDSNDNCNAENCHFFCSENEVRLLLMFLNTVCDELKRRNPFDKTSEEFKRFTELNKHLADGLWRLELLTNCNYEGSTNVKIENSIVSYMLAPPESLIHLCLKQNDFIKAHQVVQIFNLHDTAIAREIDYSTKLIQLKQSLKKTYSWQTRRRESSGLQIPGLEQTPNATIEKFLESNPVAENEDDSCIIVDNAQTHGDLSHYSADNSNFMTVFDLAVTQSDTFEKCEELLNMAVLHNNLNPNVDSNYANFCKSIQDILMEVNNKYTASVRDILCNPEFDLDVEKYKASETFYSELCQLCTLFNKQLSSESVGKLNSKHNVHKTYLKLHQLCTFSASELQKQEQIKYLQRLLNYLKGFCKIFYLEQNNSELISKGRDTSFFQALSLSRSAVLERLLFEKKLDLSDFEQLFSKLKLDLVYHVATIFFPKIELCIKGLTGHNQYVQPKNSPNTNIISYVQKRNWLLAFILSEVYRIAETKMDINEVRIKTFINFIRLSRIQNLKALYGNNDVVAALQHLINLHCVKQYFEQHIVTPEIEEVAQHGILSSQISTCSLETGEEIFEGDLKITNWKHLFDVIDSIPTNQLYQSKDLRCLRDMVLSELVGDCFEPDYFKYARLISDDRLRWECILNNLTTWPGEFCIEILKSELSNFNGIENEYAAKFTAWCEKIELYESMKIVLHKNSWFEIFLLCKNNPREVLQNLLNTVEVDLLLKFLKIHEVTVEALEIIDETYFVALFDSHIGLIKIEDLLENLPENQQVRICYNLLKTLKKLEHLNFVADLISKSDLGKSEMFRNIQVSLKILSCFTTVEQEQLWCLVADPVSIIEILIMNTKLEKLGQVLEMIRPDIENCEFDEDQLSDEKIDELLRKYAEKSLEFRVILQPGPRLSRTPESSKLMQSLDSANFPIGRRYFAMPETVPDKSEWVQNNDVTECMCCNETIFSMFNRRHHCRRCGRVICGTCSLKRMQVPTYEDILVRVCLDCYEQSYQDGAGTSSSKSETSTKSVGCDYWLLTNDPNHNQVVREEFSYEYAPSVSLCLAILKHHSKNEEYPKFLLDQCDGMLSLLQPTNSDTMQEIDYLLVIKMLKSLAIAAKMLSAQCMLQWGTSLADRILSQADLLGLLAERGCLHLIPATGQNQSRYIDAATLRRLRDKLLEREQWNLALEVSTKAGLDNSGVFAAWGKSYLKAGSLQLAREKFQRCFDKTAHYDASTELSDSFSSIHLSQFRKPLLMLPENRPAKNPPLLNEIIHILESNTSVINPKILKDVKSAKPLSSSSWSLSSSVNLPMQSDPAICILNKLKNLSNIAAGNYCGVSDCSDSVKSLSVQKPHLEPLFYEECVYYLTKYGSHMSLLEFYVKHGDFHECLQHMLENRLSSDIFIEIYMICLRENLINALHESLSKIDSTLDVWKDYLKHICRHLEKQSKLHSLYQLQQFMGDCVRAAMTCIKFYKDEATTYMELTSRVDYLHKAQRHLQQELEQEQWVEVATVRKSSTSSQDSYEAKGIANPSLVMKMDSKNVDRHINTIWRQIEVAKFLAECESSGMPILEILPEILPFINEDSPAGEMNKVKIPTLFGSYYERVQLAVLAIVCGNNVEDGFGIAFRIIQDYKLNPVKVYCQAGKQLAKTERYTGIAQLVSCIRSSGVSDSAVTDMCDEMLILAVQTLTKANATGPQLDGLIKLITDRAAKISAYIETKQLKSAYLLAVKHKRMGDIRRILREAEFMNAPNIKALCQKILHAYSHSPSHSKD